MIYRLGDTANRSVACDLIEHLVPTDAVMKLLSIDVTQEDLTSVAFWLVTLRRVTGAPTSGSGGNTPTPRPTMTGWPASGSTVETFNTTQLTGGTNVVLDSYRMNIINGLSIRDIPEEFAYFSPSERMLLELETAPSGATDISVTYKFQEIGG